MGKMKSARRKKNVIPLSMDATFFFERAIRSLDRSRYEQALKYFRRATELEPDNPVNHCNMAGILSEMGDFEQSNAILSKILAEIDPGMTECYFYMANNYANMEDFEAAETALLQYLEQDPDGPFHEEAEEMMDLLGYELNRPVRVGPAHQREAWLAHDRARTLLEAGRFAEAAGQLENIVADHPDLLAARNNLALAYYYMGEYEQSLDQIRSVLRQDPGNVHARCNLAIFCRHFGHREELGRLVAGLKRLVPFYPEHAFKVATTLGMLGEHEAAHAHFRRLMKEGEGAGDPAFCHYAAVAAVGSGRKAEALALWRRAAKLDGPGSVAAFWLDEWHRREAAGGRWEHLPSYYYLLPFEEQLRIAEQTGESLAAAAARDPLVTASLLWTLEHGDADGKLAAVQAAGRLAAEGFAEAAERAASPGAATGPARDIRDALERVAASPAERRDVRRLARRVLDGTALPALGRLPRWEGKWQAVVEKALACMAQRDNVIQRRDLQTLWVYFLSRTYPDVPTVGKVEGWAAALEYLTAKMHRQAITYREVCARYGVSRQTVSRHVRAIDRACGLREKMQNLFGTNGDASR